MKLCLRCNQYFEDGIELCPIDSSQLEAVGDHPLIGALINDRYVVDSVIGKGSTGIVYKATRLLMGSEVAVKVLHSYLGAESGALDRFLREARAASRLRHPHIINIWESGVTDDGQPYFVMDYLEGMTLADLIKQKGFLHPVKAVPIIQQVCEALAEAHRQNIIHRDIKPENIVLQESNYADQGQDFVKVLDFGIADAPAGSKEPGAKSRAKVAAGSPAYMSPEQCQGFELDQRSDIYSLGIVVFEMLTGLRPYNADEVMALFKQHVSQTPPTLSSVRPDLKFSDALEAAMAKALAKKPDKRQQSIKEFQKDLEEACRVTDTGGKSRKVESASVDLFLVPMGDRLTDDGSATGGHNFLPGPEDWIDDEPEPPPPPPPIPKEPTTRVWSAPASASSDSLPRITDAPAQTAKEEEIPSNGPAEEPTTNYTAAVDRLLKSAKRAASEASTQGVPEPGQSSTPSPAAPPDVSNWAREVLTRTPEPVKEDSPKAQENFAPPAAKAQQETSRSRADTGDLPTDAIKERMEGRSEDSLTRHESEHGEKPEPTDWAQRVLNRDVEPSPVVSEPAESIPAAPTAVDDPFAALSTPPSFTQAPKPEPFAPLSESFAKEPFVPQIDEPFSPSPASEPAKPAPPPVPTPAPVPAPQAQAPAQPKFTSSALSELEAMSADDDDDFYAAPPQPAPTLPPQPVSDFSRPPEAAPMAAQASTDFSNPDAGFGKTIEASKPDLSSITADPFANISKPDFMDPALLEKTVESLPAAVKPSAPPPAPVVQPAAPVEKPAEKPFSLSDLDAIKTPPKSPPPPAEPPKPVVPEPPKPAPPPEKPKHSIAEAAGRLLGALKDKKPKGKDAKAEPAKGADKHDFSPAGGPDLVNREPQAANPFAEAVDKLLDASILPAQKPNKAAPPKGKAASDGFGYSQDDLKRFNEPVNKGTQSMNPFSEAVDSLLDAAILPQKGGDKESLKPADDQPRESMQRFSGAMQDIGDAGLGVAMPEPSPAEEPKKSFDASPAKDPFAPEAGFQDFGDAISAFAATQPPADVDPFAPPGKSESEDKFSRPEPEQENEKHLEPFDITELDNIGKKEEPKEEAKEEAKEEKKEAKPYDLSELDAIRFRGTKEVDKPAFDRSELDGIKSPDKESTTKPFDPSELDSIKAPSKFSGEETGKIQIGRAELDAMEASPKKPFDLSELDAIKSPGMSDLKAEDTGMLNINRSDLDGIKAPAGEVEKKPPAFDRAELDAIRGAIAGEQAKDSFDKSSLDSIKTPGKSLIEPKPKLGSDKSDLDAIKTPGTAAPSSGGGLGGGLGSKFARPSSTPATPAKPAEPAEPAEPAQPAASAGDKSPFDSLPSFSESMLRDARQQSGEIETAGIEAALEKQKQLEKELEETGMLDISKKPVVDEKRFGEPIKKSEDDKPKFDPKRFSQPVNKTGEFETYNALANAVDDALEAAIMKEPLRKQDMQLPTSTSFKRPAEEESLPPPPPPPQPVESLLSSPPQPTESMRSGLDAALDASFEAMMAPSVERIPAAAKFTPPAPEPADKLPTKPAEEEPISDAVSRLIEAAKMAPEAPAAAKPEALNKKIEAVKKKIEALKAAQGANDSGKPAMSAPPAAAQDSHSLTEQVNRLLEAAQKVPESGTYNPVPPSVSTSGPYGDFSAPVRTQQYAPVPDMPINPAAQTSTAAEIVNQAIKSSKVAGENPQDYYSGFVQTGPTSRQLERKAAESRRKDRARARATFQSRPGLNLPIMILLALLVGGFTYAYFNGYIQFNTKTAGTAVSVDDMIKDGKLDQARPLLEKRLKNLTASETEHYGQLCVALAKKYAEQERYPEAVSILGKVPRKYSKSREANKLSREYKKKLSTQ